MFCLLLLQLSSVTHTKQWFAQCPKASKKYAHYVRGLIITLCIEMEKLFTIVLQAFLHDQGPKILAIIVKENELGPDCSNIKLS